MNKIVDIRNCLATALEDECLADEILSFSVQIDCDFSYENFISYPFMISFPGLRVCLKNNDWKTQFEDCLSMKFICNLNVADEDVRLGDKGAIVIADSLKTNSILKNINLCRNNIGVEGAIAIANTLK